MEIETALQILVTKKMAEGKVIKDTLECKANLSNFAAQSLAIMRSSVSAAL